MGSHVVLICIGLRFHHLNVCLTHTPMCMHMCVHTDQFSLPSTVHMTYDYLKAKEKYLQVSLVCLVRFEKLQ